MLGYNNWDPDSNKCNHIKHAVSASVFTIVIHGSYKAFHLAEGFQKHTVYYTLLINYKKQTTSQNAVKQLMVHFKNLIKSH